MNLLPCLFRRSWRLALIVGLVAWIGSNRCFAVDVLEPGSSYTRIVDNCKFTEGPSIDAQGNLYFSDGPNDRIMKRTPDGTLSVFRQPCGRTNGTAFDPEGNLIMCQSAGEGGKRRVARLEANGKETVLLDEYNGRPLIAPNDVCVDRAGRIYFTDPYFGPPAEKSQPTSGVYRIDKPGKGVLLLNDLGRPNGIALSPNGKVLYVSDRSTQKLHRYQVDDAGNLTPDGIVYDFSPDRGVDGMRIDVEGNIYAAAGQDKTTGLFVVSPEGKLLLHQPMPEFSTNLVFGGPDRRTIYFTATTSVYQLRSVRPGLPLPPRGP